MNISLKKVMILLKILIFFGYCSMPAQDSDLVAGFRNPGKEARPRAYWNWLNGDVSHSGLTRDLEEAKAKGLGGLLMWDTEAMRNLDGFVPTGPPFLGAESVGSIHHAMNEARYLYVAVLAWPDSENKLIPNASEVINLSDMFKAGELDWTPKGTWRVTRFVCTNNGQQLIAASPNSKGLFIDFLDPEATRFHSAGVLWKPPFLTDITPFVRPGANDLKIEVMSLW